MKHRILHLVSSLAHGGTQRQMALVAAGLPRAEFDVQVAAVGPSGPTARELAEQEVPALAIGSRGLLDVGAWSKARRLIQRASLIHLWDAVATRQYTSIALFGAARGKLIVTQRSLSACAERSLFGRFFRRRTATAVASCRAVEHALGREGWPAEKQMVIVDGTPTKSAPAGSRKEFLAELQIPENSRLLVTVGPLTREKRIKDLIWAADMLKFFRDDIHLLVVGDGPHRARLELFTRQCEIEDKVHFLGDRSDVPRILPHCAALFCAGGTTGPSNAILEAMMAGIPVVAADTPINRELIVSNESGILAPLGDRNQFARAAHKLTTDPALHQRLAAAARRRALEHFTAERMVNEYLAHYRQVLARS